MAKIVRHKILDNGLDVYFQKDDNSHLFGVGVKSGYFSDPEYAPGLAHLSEHVVTSHPIISEYKRIERHLRRYGCGPGGDIDIGTGQFYTFYGTELLLRKKYAEELFEIFTGMVKTRRVDPTVLKSELAALNTEHLYLEDTMYNLLHRITYDKNPARRGITDDPERLNLLKPRDISEFLERHYIPNNMFLILLGPSESEAMAIADRYFGEMQPRTVPRIRYDRSEPRPELAGVKSVLKEKPGTFVYQVGMGFPTEPFGHNSDEMIDVLSEVLELRIETALRRENHAFGRGAYHPYVMISRSPLHGMLYITFETPSESYAYEGIDRVINECEKLKRRGVDQREIDLALSKIPESERRIGERKMLGKPYREEFKADVEMGINAKKVEYLSGFETSPAILKSMIIDCACMEGSDKKGNGQNGNGIAWVNNYRKKLDEITAPKLANAASKYLTTPDKFSLVMIAPGEKDLMIEDFYEERKKQLKLDF